MDKPSCDIQQILAREKLDKFLTRLDKFVAELKRNQQLDIHASINQAYYMQKIAELSLQQENLMNALNRLQMVQEGIEKNYREVFSRWSREVRWLNKRLSEEYP